MKQRIISALVALLILVPITIIGGIYFKLTFSLLSIMALYEILRASSKNNKYPNMILILSYILIFLLVFVDLNVIIKLSLLFFILALPLIFYDKDKYNIESFSFIIFSILFISFVFSYLISIRENDIHLFIFMFLITILTDSFAYIGGKLFGKHKLIPKVSPNKTIEGSVIGSLFGIVIPSIYYIYMVDPGESIFLVVISVLVLSILGQIGDLFFSSIKRYYGIKDYSNIMPGHGGVLDRLDSIIFVVIGYALIINM